MSDVALELGGANRELASDIGARISIALVQVVLDYVTLPVKRRVDVPADIWPDQLHAALGWTDPHLREFCTTRGMGRSQSELHPEIVLAERRINDVSGV